MEKNYASDREERAAARRPSVQRRVYHFWDKKTKTGGGELNKRESAAFSRKSEHPGQERPATGEGRN
jgi:hypothetical protein